MRDGQVLRYTRTPDPMPDGWLEEWLAGFGGDRRVALAILDDEGQFVGYAVTGPVDREALEVELGYAISPWGRQAQPRSRGARPDQGDAELGARDPLRPPLHRASPRAAGDDARRPGAPLHPHSRPDARRVARGVAGGLRRRSTRGSRDPG